MNAEDTNKTVIEHLIELLAIKQRQLQEKDRYILDLEIELKLRPPHD